MTFDLFLEKMILNKKRTVKDLAADFGCRFDIIDSTNLYFMITSVDLSKSLLFTFCNSKFLTFFGSLQNSKNYKSIKGESHSLQM